MLTVIKEQHSSPNTYVLLVNFMHIDVFVTRLHFTMSGFSSLNTGYRLSTYDREKLRASVGIHKCQTNSPGGHICAVLLNNSLL